MQEKKENNAKKKATTKKKDITKKEDTAPKEDTAKKEESAKKPHFSEKRIKEIVERLKKKVAEHRQLQEEGILPYCKRIPITVMEIKYVMVIIGRSRNIASKVLQKVREELGKKPRQRVSVTEFCERTGIPLDDVRQALNLLT
jgi:hypothetical protein